MALRKFQLAIECDSEEEFNAAQEALRQISGMRLMTAKGLITYYPLMKSKEREIMQLFRLFAEKGKKALTSIEGAKLMWSLTNK